MSGRVFEALPTVALPGDYYRLYSARSGTVKRAPRRYPAAPVFQALCQPTAAPYQTSKTRPYRKRKGVSGIGLAHRLINYQAAIAFWRWLKRQRVFLIFSRQAAGCVYN